MQISFQLLPVFYFLFTLWEFELTSGPVSAFTAFYGTKLLLICGSQHTGACFLGCPSFFVALEAIQRKHRTEPRRTDGPDEGIKESFKAPVVATRIPVTSNSLVLLDI